MTRPLLLWWLLGLSFAACQPSRTIAGRKATNPLERILAEHAADFDSLLRQPERYEIQIIYTRIDRDARQQPTFTSYYWNVDSNRYFYPASMVKMPLALLALEKLQALRRDGYPRLDRDTPYRIDSLRPFQRHYHADTTAPAGRPTLAHDIRRVFTVSDNQAYNHLFEFLGRQYINTALRAKGYAHTGIVRRFYAGGRDNAYSSPISFYRSENSALWRQGELFDSTTWVNPQHGLKKGRGYLDNQGNRVEGPFDFAHQNWFALTDMERMLRAVIFPEATPPDARFHLAERDYPFLWHYMGIFPRECDFPAYSPSEYWDGYAKFLLFGDTRAQQDGKVRVFNKIGEAYGTLTDVAYVIDPDHQVEFILAATILCNSDGVFNDDRYDYETVGIPFLARLGRAVLEHERRRERRVKPDLSRFVKALRNGE